MADIQHSAITDPHIHEPKGASTASGGTVYISDGSGSGSWTVVGLSNLDYSAIQAQVQTDIDNTDIEITGKTFFTTVIADISTASSVIIPIPATGKVTGGSVVLGGAITDADASITFLNSTGASMGSPVTVLFTSSGKGDQYSWTATGNNELTGPTWIEVVTDGGSTGAQALYITIEYELIVN